MNKALLSMVALGAIAAAAPAAGQTWNDNRDVYADGSFAVGIQERLARLDARIDAGVRAGTIDHREARRLRQRLREIARLERQYRRNGLSEHERADLRQRVRSFREELRLAGGGRYGNDRYGNDRYGNDRYGGYDPDDDYYGQGGPYEECYDDDRRRGGLGGVLDGIFGRDDDDDHCAATLRVGARASANLGPVPSEYRYRFRDGNGVYYRSDGRAIYQIDARTRTVLRVYDID
jgi:hypothetical protein